MAPLTGSSTPDVRPGGIYNYLLILLVLLMLYVTDMVLTRYQSPEQGLDFDSLVQEAVIEISDEI